MTPRVFVADAAGLVSFLRHAFDATVDDSTYPINVHIGDSRLIVSSTAERDEFTAFLYVYVEDADATYERALAAGATTLESPLDTPYGDRRAMVRDPFGNVYQIAHPLAAG